MVSKNTICLWYNGTAQDAAEFYARTFPDSAVVAVHHAPGDYPAGKQGDVITVEFTRLPMQRPSEIIELLPHRWRPFNHARSFGRTLTAQGLATRFEKMRKRWT